MALFAQSFNYHGVSSEAFRLELVAFENDSPLTALYQKSAIKGDIRMHHPIPVRQGMKYTDVLKINISLIKSDGILHHRCGTPADLPLAQRKPYAAAALFYRM